MRAMQKMQVTKVILNAVRMFDEPVGLSATYLSATIKVIYEDKQFRDN